MRTLSLFCVVREYNAVLSCIQMTRNGIEQFTICKCRGCLKPNMTIVARIYAFITLKIQFPVSVSAQILGGHRSTLLSTLCLHASYCFFSALSICCFRLSMYYPLLNLGRKLVLSKECYSIFFTVYYCQLLISSFRTRKCKIQYHQQLSMSSMYRIASDTLGFPLICSGGKGECNLGFVCLDWSTFP